jgi:hypothetical protein
MKHSMRVHSRCYKEHEIRAVLNAFFCYKFTVTKTNNLIKISDTFNASPDIKSTIMIRPLRLIIMK